MVYNESESAVAEDSLHRLESTHVDLHRMEQKNEILQSASH